MLTIAGWTVVGQQFVAGLGQTLNNALNAAIPALVARINPIAQVGEVVDIYEKTQDPQKPPQKPDDVAAKGPVPDQPNVQPADYNDPAYKVIGTISDVSSILLSLLTSGKDGGVDWDHAKPKAGDSNHSAGYVLSMLQFSQQNFKSSDRPPSQKLTTALTSILKVHLPSLHRQNLSHFQ